MGRSRSHRPGSEQTARRRIFRRSSSVGIGLLLAAVAVLLVLEGSFDLAVFFAVLAAVLLAGASDR